MKYQYHLNIQTLTQNTLYRRLSGLCSTRKNNVKFELLYFLYEIPVEDGKDILDMVTSFKIYNLAHSHTENGTSSEIVSEMRF